MLMALCETMIWFCFFFFFFFNFKANSAVLMTGLKKLNSDSVGLDSRIYRDECHKITCLGNRLTLKPMILWKLNIDIRFHVNWFDNFESEIFRNVGINGSNYLKYYMCYLIRWCWKKKLNYFGWRFLSRLRTNNLFIKLGWTEMKRLYCIKICVRIN